MRLFVQLCAAEVTKRGNASLRNLMIEWRDRYEENTEEATREILNFVLQVQTEIQSSAAIVAVLLLMFLLLLFAPGMRR